MVKSVCGALAVVVLLSPVVPAFAKTETIRGKVVDQNCYLKDRANNAGVEIGRASCRERV